MPYIKEEDREKFLAAEEAMAKIENAGQLNYFVTRTFLNYVKTKGIKYQTLNDIGGVLNWVGHEFYRRLISWYEDTKIKENGDILTEDDRKALKLR
jgi:hypothetical protein